MARVCLGAEKIPSINVSKHRLDVQFDNVEEAIAMSAMYAANHLKGVTAIITMTESGRTALMTSVSALVCQFSPCRAMNVR
ncbi:pyruvate kinase [Escherichia coli]|uniref:Pyruvate kinase n=1 Tax=Escherichia coli TaxID=562 RepID=A0A377CFQ5_ECOLX|nr:pyruvate kinase [Escherichia coli]